MKRYQFITLSLLMVLSIGAVLITQVNASPLFGSGSPTVVSYQGVIHDGGSPYTGTGYFKFALVDAVGTTTYWSNDSSSSGGGEPTGGVSLPVADGQFQVFLGDTGLVNMTALPASVFSGTERYLRIWFSPDDISYTALSPDQRIAAVPYALQAEEAQYARDADTVDGYQAFELQNHYQNVIIVAQSGGDFTSIQAAVDSITDASESNPYLIWIAPGVYQETVTMKQDIHLQGAGQKVTIITSSVTNSGLVPSEATLTLAGGVTVRDLTLVNIGSGNHNVALLERWGAAGILIEDVSIRTEGVGSNNYGVFYLCLGRLVLN